MTLGAAELGAPRSYGAAIAHELNNVLTVLRTYTHFARQPSTPERRAEDLRVVAAATERASALVDWLSSRGEEAAKAPDEISANDFISAVSERLQQLVQPGTTIELMRVGRDLWLRANALRLEHVVMSLVLAASQRWAQTAFSFSLEQSTDAGSTPPGPAAAGDGVIVITCRDATKESDWQAKLLVPEDQLSALIAPLAELLSAMQGRLEFVRASGGEDRFELHLPKVETPAPSVAAARLVLVPPGVSTLCIIENETAIRLAVSRALSSAGYLVLQANDSVSAREVLIRHGRAVRLLICDVGLLRANEEFFAWVRATCPGAALLLISGDTQAGQAQASSLRARFLPKPFVPSELVSAVKQALARATNALHGAADAKRLQVLLVDDEQVIRDSLERLLLECDFDTVSTSSGLHALRLLEDRHIDAIVTDQFMPGVSGVDLLELVHDRFPACVRILCTGYPSSDVVVNAVNRGRVHRVLPKSMHAVALRDEIERAILERIQQA